MKSIGKAITAIEPAPEVAPPRPAAAGPEPAPGNVIAGWLLTFANTRMRGKPETPAQLSEEIADIVDVCGDLPAGCWTEETLRQAKLNFVFWPGPAQLARFFEPIADTARTHHRIAVARRTLVIPARESREVYVPPAPQPPPDPRPARQGFEPPSAEELAETERRRVEQLSVLTAAVSPVDEARAREAYLQRRGQQQPPPPPPPRYAANDTTPPLPKPEAKS